tara:strand:- start:39 stop:518 length:480 start_codon:yes stop_codon:yes gene_type:complete
VGRLRSSVNDEDSDPNRTSFNEDDVRWVCRKANRIGSQEKHEARFLISMADNQQVVLEDAATECQMTKNGYRYLRMMCAGDFQALAGLEKIKAFRERVAEIILRESYNRKRKQEHAHVKGERPVVTAPSRLTPVQKIELKKSLYMRHLMKRELDRDGDL